MTAYKVKAHWDSEDRVWWAECAENHGVVAEAASVEGLLEAIQKTFPDLVDLDRQLGPEEVWARRSGWRSRETLGHLGLRRVVQLNKGPAE
jgi:hypothetical protein